MSKKPRAKNRKKKKSSTGPNLTRAEYLESQGRIVEAERFYRQVLRAEPNEVRALRGLATARRLQGATDVAWTLIHKAYTTHLDHSESHAETAYQLLAQNNLQTAQEAATTAISLDPNSPHGHLALAQVYSALNQPSSVFSEAEQAAALAPDHPMVQTGTARLFFKHGRQGRAVPFYQRANELIPSDNDVLFELAGVLRISGQLRESIPYFEQLITRSKHRHESIAGLADAYLSLGEVDRATDLINPCLDQNEHHPAIADMAGRLVAGSSSNEQVTDTLDYIEQSITKAKSDPLSRSYVIAAGYRAGALREQIGHHDQAFAWYRRSNEAYPRTFQPPRFEQHITRLMEAFSEATLHNMARSHNDSGNLIFILGMPRSGTSLVEQILASHPKVQGGGELDHLSNLTRSLPQRFGPSYTYPTGPSLLTEDQWNELAQHHLDTLVPLHDGSSCLTDKMPHNFEHIGFLSRLLPNARIVHCTRDPIDTCLSCYATPLSPALNYTRHLSDLVFAYKHYRRLLDHWHRLLPGFVYDVSYESLIADRENQTRYLLEFCGLDWDDACLQPHKNKRITSTASMDQVRRPVYTSSVHRWRKFSKKDLKPLIDGLAPWMESGTNIG